MAEEITRRLKQVATTLNIGTSTIVDYLSAKGFDIQNKPTAKITAEQFGMLKKEFASSMQDKQEAAELNIGKKPQSNVVIEADAQEEKPAPEQEDEVLIKNLQTKKPEPQPEPAPKPAEEEKATGSRLQGIKVVGKIELDAKGRPVTQTIRSELNYSSLII